MGSSRHHRRSTERLEVRAVHKAPSDLRVLARAFIGYALSRSPRNRRRADSAQSAPMTTPPGQGRRSTGESASTPDRTGSRTKSA